MSKKILLNSVCGGNVTISNHI